MTLRDATRERILEAASSMFRRYGPTKTSIADIARELCMSPANVYNFFPSKDALFEDVAERFFCELRHEVQRVIASIDDPWQAITALFVTVARELRSRTSNEKDVIQLQLQILNKKHAWQFIENFNRFIVQTLEALILRVIERRRLTGLEAAAAAEALFDCMLIAIEPALINRTGQADHERRLCAQLALLDRAFSENNGAAP
jgi:AcrR family transcriptional regulator